jgi:predicted CxxxxCH...CXXCH cytochrome family protein
MRYLLALAVLVIGCNNRYHPDNFAVGSVHGAEITRFDQDCRSCHGADLAGGTAKVSCDGCHSGPTPTSWRTNCTFCHGGTDNQTGAPPRDLAGMASPFLDHTKHVSAGTMSRGFDCNQCHVKATDVLSPGHIFGNPPGGALNDFGAGLSPQGTFDKTTATCSNLYCHGTGRGDTGSIATGATLACSGCHATMESGATGWAKLSGPHGSHLQSTSGITCADCHSQTTTDGVAIAAAGMPMHVNGKVEVGFTAASFTYNATNATCTGTCHGYSHSNLGWQSGGIGGTYHPPGYNDPSAHGVDMELQRQDCRGCHGADLKGGTAGQPLVGVSCDGCHTGATTTTWRSDCVFCHGGGNGDTRGMPPRDPGSTNTSVSQRFVSHANHVQPTLMSANDCTTCHKLPTDVLSMGHAFNSFDNQPNVIFTDGRNPSATYTATTGTCGTLYCHGNGQASNGTATDGGAPMTCTSCHGGDANARAGLSAHHRNDHGGVACTKCHAATVSSGTAILDPTKHINQTKDVVFSGGGTYTASTKTCSNIGCHGTQTW